MRFIRTIPMKMRMKVRMLMLMQMMVMVMMMMMRRLLIPNICGLPSEGRKVLRRGTEAPTPRATPSGGAIAGPNFSSMQSAWRMLKLASIMNILKKFLMTHGIREKSPIPGKHHYTSLGSHDLRNPGRPSREVRLSQKPAPSQIMLGCGVVCRHHRHRHPNIMVDVVVMAVIVVMHTDSYNTGLKAARTNLLLRLRVISEFLTCQCTCYGIPMKDFPVDEKSYLISPLLFCLSDTLVEVSLPTAPRDLCISLHCHVAAWQRPLFLAPFAIRFSIIPRPRLPHPESHEGAGHDDCQPPCL